MNKYIELWQKNQKLYNDIDNLYHYINHLKNKQIGVVDKNFVIDNYMRDGIGIRITYAKNEIGMNKLKMNALLN